MATVKKCDRCGKYYDKNTEHKQNINGRVYYEDGMCFTIVAYDVYADCKDLCDECLDKLHMFLNGAKLILEDNKHD